MKKITTYFLTALFVCSANTQVYAGEGEGNEGGGGGSGFAYAFTQLGYRLHRELLMQKYDPKQKQVRDEIRLDYFLMVVDGTKVVSTEEKLFDRDGHEATAIYKSPDELKAEYVKKGLSQQEIEDRLDRMPFGLITVNSDRFKDEMNSNFSLVLALVFHEYLRALGLPDDRYRLSAKNYGQEFFEKIERESSPVSKKVYSEVKSNPQLALQRIQLIDQEKLRLEQEMQEDHRDLSLIVIERRPYVDAQRKAFSKKMNAYASLAESMGMISFGSAIRGRLLRGIGLVGNAALDMQQKLTELEVIDLKMKFLMANYSRNAEFYEKIDYRRQELFCEQVGGCD